ncbi:rab GDP dissociation inhibitor alpha-like [Patiria miniata]|uniref:Rab GDP dissociation inhibitor n=1 Tax=Patiria miniata TaxID=46514 RepID=A0A914AVK1_PATMI|nr:rab GDP dissociation inhibitor alpha-like [Patiria miniata]
MDEEYDAIILGTGLKECVISGLLSVAGKKVLHMDRNSYYGGDSASITPLSEMFKRYGRGDELSEEKNYGKDNSWNVDLIPKLIMANGELVRMLVLSGVTRYLEFKTIESSYVFYNGKISKLPATDAEALKTELVSFFAKKRFGNLVKNIMHSTEDGAIAEKGYVKGMTTEDMIKLFDISNVKDVIGHAIALHLDDDYLQQPCEETVKRLKLYFDSVAKYGKSPYLYPLYGLGELPQGFARLSAIYGGTYMLNKPIEEVVMEDGKVVGVKSQGETARTKLVVGDPSYFPDLVKQTGEVVRAICILDHPVCTKKGSPVGVSTQIIFPCSQVAGRKSDIYVCCVSFAHNVASKGHYVAIASCKVETDDPIKELDIALEVLKPIKAQFNSVDKIYEPINDGTENNVFITTSYDATTHFESTCANIHDVYKRVTGQPMDFSKVKVDLEVEN